MDLLEKPDFHSLPPFHLVTTCYWGLRTCRLGGLSWREVGVAQVAQIRLVFRARVFSSIFFGSFLCGKDKVSIDGRSSWKGLKAPARLWEKQWKEDFGQNLNIEYLLRLNLSNGTKHNPKKLPPWELIICKMTKVTTPIPQHGWWPRWCHEIYLYDLTQVGSLRQFGLWPKRITFHWSACSVHLPIFFQVLRIFLSRTLLGTTWSFQEQNHFSSEPRPTPIYMDWLEEDSVSAANATDTTELRSEFFGRTALFRSFKSHD